MIIGCIMPFFFRRLLVALQTHKFLHAYHQNSQLPMPKKQLFLCSSKICIGVGTCTSSIEAETVIELIFKYQDVPDTNAVVAPTDKKTTLMFSVRKGRLNVRFNLNNFLSRDGRI